MMFDLGETLIQARLKKGLSLRAAASAIGISHTYLSALEKGYDPRSGIKITPSQEVLVKLCSAYGLQLSDIAPVLVLQDEYSLYEFAARGIAGLRKTDPDRYARLLDIIVSGGKKSQ